MDVMMPVMAGLEAARYIRWSNKANARDIPIIAMTANAFTEDRRRVLEAGMNEHLGEPMGSEVLLKTIAKS
ncbi:response regulator, partial [Anaerostipes hadrus]|uniref:response regulator n=1 Tax=Anaerostipes hadrus TaxID=649756 RepID=UPI001ADDBD10